MRAIRLHAFGPAENLIHEEVDDPRPAPGQVRVKVAAAGVHLLDTALREGMRGPAPELPALPTIPGREVAGTVDALGEGTDPAWLGRHVVAHLGFAPGGYAELAVTDAARLHRIPAGLDAARAVAMIGTGRTALGILQFADLGPGAVALVPAAAGGIGTLLVQYAKNAGATVVGLAGGPEKTARVQANGADLAVDYTDPDWPGKVRAYLGGPRATVVFDGVGGDTARDLVGLLAPGGRHLVFGWSSEGLRDGTGYHLDGVSQSVLGPAMLARAGGPDPLRTLELRALTEAAEGRLTPAVHRFPLAEAAAAHRALETRRTTGKVVLEP
ncbi:MULTISPECIES: zinc-binding dehydrogenase [Streptomyces]|uniref:Oxidoreductase n=2 Tax=Streptomyces TaxID=1883 RepID=A0A2U9P2Z3_STRAS|nr:zinc-binding dehydrogenase [Streptomyces actuosus]AWT43986.1 oxidoreductase [Streptomyces actuosus]MBM4820873.1 zinc-binding dehydrogenase [Streptomyces actuosus]